MTERAMYFSTLNRFLSTVGRCSVALRVGQGDLESDPLRSLTGALLTAMRVPELIISGRSFISEGTWC